MLSVIQAFTLPAEGLDGILEPALGNTPLNSCQTSHCCPSARPRRATYTRSGSDTDIFGLLAGTHHKSQQATWTFALIRQLNILVYNAPAFIRGPCYLHLTY